MRKLVYFLLFLSLPFALYIKSARADIDIIRKIVDIYREINQEADTEETILGAKIEQGKKDIVGFDKKNLETIYKKAQKAAEQAKQLITNPFGTGIELAQTLQGKLETDKNASDADKADAVKEMYSRTKDSSIDAAEEQQKATNLLLIANTSSLFAKAMVLRVNLNEEETDIPTLETKEDALRATTQSQLKDMERWNEILKMQAYISNFNNFLENQNYALDNEEDDDDKEEEK